MHPRLAAHRGGGAVMVTPCAPGYTLVTPVFGEGVTAQASGTPREFSMVTPVTPELRTYKGDSRGEDGAHGAGTHTRPPSREIGCNGCNGVTGVTGTQPSGAPGWLRQTARAALPTHDPASVPSAASPEPPGCLCAPPAAVPWLAPPTAGASMAGGAVVTRCASRPSPSAPSSSRAAGLPCSGAWASGSTTAATAGDGGGRGLLRSRDGTGAGLAPMAGEARATVHLGVPFWQQWQRERQNGNDR